MKNINKALVIISLAILVVLVTGISGCKTDNLPEKFTIQVYYSGTSSAASRTWETNSTFDGSKLISSFIITDFDDYQRAKYCVEHFDATTNSWINDVWVHLLLNETTRERYSVNDSAELCGGEENAYLTRDKIIQNIQNGTIKQAENCHYETCYKII